MIIQPLKSKRNVNDLFCASEKQRINRLNKEFFQNVELTEKENALLVWLCGWDNRTFDTVMDIFRKIKEI